MLSKALVVSSLASSAAHVPLDNMDDFSLPSIDADDECAASDPDKQRQCALHALQVKAKRVDLESEEGASLIEASREWYAGEQSENHTEFLGARHGVAPPRSAFQYNGISWPELHASADPDGASHFFAIGDWGGMDGALEPPDGLPRMITYPGGHLPGPHVFPRSRLACGNKALTNCYFGKEKHCSYSCGFAAGVDDKAQLLVAEQMKRRARKHRPQFFLNVGDNFYWGGIAKTCGHPMNQIHWATRHQFKSIFEDVYRGPGIDGKPWLSVLGNHDWGGRMFTAGWDQQIAYTWASDRWTMPAAYWHQRVQFPGYAADIYMVDTNHHDAKAPYQDKATNICGSSFNPKGASCSSAGGPSSVETCRDWFQSLWKEEQTWLEKKLASSDAAWQMIVTHFPCDKSSRYWRKLHDQYGLDLLVTGHRHDQELYKAGSVYLGGLTCFVTGGGGGITSEESPLKGRPSHYWQHVNAQYGFYDMTIRKESIKIESIDHRGQVVDTTVVQPKDRPQ